MCSELDMAESGFGPVVKRVRVQQLMPSIDAYTLRAVGQDEFEDVKVPDAPATSAQQSGK